MSEDFDIRNAAGQVAGSSEKEIERAMRPLSFSAFAGQEKVVDNLKVFVTAARMRGSSRPSAAVRASGSGQDHSQRHNRQRAWSGLQSDIGACSRQAGRSGRNSDIAGAQRRSFY